MSYCPSKSSTHFLTTNCSSGIQGVHLLHLTAAKCWFLPLFSDHRGQGSMLSTMAKRLLNPFSLSSKLQLSMLVDSSPILPVVHELKTRYRPDILPIPSLARGNSFAPGEHIRVPVFHELPQKYWDLYHSSLLRIAQSRARFPITILKPFATLTRRQKAIGFNIRLSELYSIRNELARDLDRFIKLQTIITRRVAGRISNNLRFNRRCLCMVSPKTSMSRFARN